MQAHIENALDQGLTQTRGKMQNERKESCPTPFLPVQTSNDVPSTEKKSRDPPKEQVSSNCSKEKETEGWSLGIKYSYTENLHFAMDFPA